MAVCDLLLAVGIAGAFGCPAPVPDTLPADDPSAYEFKMPEPEPAPAKPAPHFPPVIIKKVIEKKIVLPPPIKEEEPEPVLPSVPDTTSLDVEKVYERRVKGNRKLFSIHGVSVKDDETIPPISTAPEFSAPSIETPEKYSAEGVVSSGAVDNSRIVTTDRYITGILETGINSQLSGDGAPVVIQVSRNVFGYHGRNILIPKGSRLVCEYSGPDKAGISRSAITCSRILLADSRAEIYQLAAMGADVQGHLGVSGDLDNRFFERYGTAFILAGISASVRAAAQGASDASADETTATSAIVTTGAEELSQRFGEITAQMLEANVNLKPILRIPQGTRLQIRPASDWYIKKTGV